MSRKITLTLSLEQADALSEFLTDGLEAYTDDLVRASDHVGEMEETLDRLQEVAERLDLAIDLADEAA